MVLRQEAFISLGLILLVSPLVVESHTVDCRTDELGTNYVGHTSLPGCAPWTSVPWVSKAVFKDSAVAAGSACRSIRLKHKQFPLSCPLMGRKGFAVCDHIPLCPGVHHPIAPMPAMNTKGSVHTSGGGDNQVHITTSEAVYHGNHHGGRRSRPRHRMERMFDLESFFGSHSRRRGSHGRGRGSHGRGRGSHSRGGRGTGFHITKTFRGNGGGGLRWSWDSLNPFDPSLQDDPHGAGESQIRVKIMTSPDEDPCIQLEHGKKGHVDVQHGGHRILSAKEVKIVCRKIKANGNKPFTTKVGTWVITRSGPGRWSFVRKSGKGIGGGAAKPTPENTPTQKPSVVEIIPAKGKEPLIPRAKRGPK